MNKLVKAGKYGFDIGNGLIEVLEDGLFVQGVKVSDVLFHDVTIEHCYVNVTNRVIIQDESRPIRAEAWDAKQTGRYHRDLKRYNSWFWRSVRRVFRKPHYEPNPFNVRIMNCHFDAV